MERGPLLAWQWVDYAEKHQGRTNLLLHIVAVPLFWFGALHLLFSPWMGLLAGVVGVASMGISLAVQGRGHRMESAAPAPFQGRGDAVRRLLAEQFITFPRYVLSGGWWRAVRNG